MKHINRYNNIEEANSGTNYSPNVTIVNNQTVYTKVSEDNTEIMFDSFPEDMLKYLQNYGFHFNKKACEFALNKMKIRQSELILKNQVDSMMSKYNINSDDDILYDAVFVSNLAKSKLGFLLQDEQRFVAFVKAYLECGNVFCKWNAALVHKGVPIEWSDLLR